MPDPTPDGLDRLRAVFSHASRLPPAERVAWVEAECAHEPELRLEVLELLSALDAPHPALEGLAGPFSIEELDTPEEIGGYEILQILGRGGMGVVFRARQRSPLREVALKLLQPGFVDAAMLRRFVHETEVLGALNHPCIAKVFAAGSFDSGFGELPYFVMELVEGQPIDTFVRSHALDAKGCCRLVIDICYAMQHAHQQGIVHRDLKPGNILVGFQERRPFPRVLDFGIARSTLADEASRLTRSGQLFGTLPYMSPEQLAGETEGVDGRTDVYSLGVLLFELLTGRLPLDVSDRPLTEALRILREEEPPLLRSVRRDLPLDLERVVARALAPDLADRYPSARALAEDLERFLDHRPVHARPPSLRDRARKFVRRNRTLVIGVTCTFVALVAGLVGMTLLALANDRLADRKGQLQLELRAGLYAAQMSDAGPLLVGSGDPEELRTLVAEWPAPTPGEPELRGWEYELVAAQAALLEDSFDVGADITQVVSAGTQMLVVAGGGLRAYEANAGRDLLAAKSDRYLRLDPTGRFAVWSEGAESTLFWAPVERLDAPSRTHPPKLNALTISPDGRWIAGVHGPNFAVLVIDTSTGEVAWEAPQERPSFDRLVFSRDGAWLYYSDRGAGRIHAVDTADWTYAWSVDLELPASCLALAPDGNLIAAGLIDGSCRVVDSAGDGFALVGPRALGPVTELVWSRNQGQLALYYEEGAILVAGVESGATTRLPWSGTGIRSLAFHGPDGALLAGGYEGRLHRFRAGGVLPVRRFEHPLRGGAPRIQWAAAGGRVLLGRSTGEGRIHDAASGALIVEVEGHLSPDGERLLRLDDERVVLSQVGGDALAELPAGRTWGAVWEPSGEHALVLGEAGIWLLDGRGRGWESAILIPAATPNAAAWSPDGSQFLHFNWGVREQGLWVRDGRTGAVVASYGPESWGGGLPSHAEWLAGQELLRLHFGPGDGRLYDPRAGELRGRSTAGIWQPGGTREVALEPSGLRIVEREGGRTVLRVPGLRGAAAWSPDGSRLAIVSEDGPAWIWSAR